MRATAMIALLPAMLLAAACSGRGNSAADDELKQDLALAASDGLGMAPAPRANVISADELGPPVTTPKAQTRKAPRKGTARPKAAVIEPTVAEAAATETAMEPAPTPTVVAESPAPTTTEPEPIATPRPRPVDLPSGGGSGGAAGDGSVSGTGEPRGGGSDVGAVIGTVIGVIIRGGVAGDDHCDPRTDGRRRRGRIVGSPSPFPGTIMRGVPSGIPITPIVPRMGAPLPRSGVAINERMPQHMSGGRMAMPRQ